MNPSWKSGTATDFLNLSPEEDAYVEFRVEILVALRSEGVMDYDHKTIDEMIKKLFELNPKIRFKMGYD